MKKTVTALVLVMAVAGLGFSQARILNSDSHQQWGSNAAGDIEYLYSTSNKQQPLVTLKADFLAWADIYSTVVVVFTENEPNQNGLRLTVLADGSGETLTWGSGYPLFNLTVFALDEEWSDKKKKQMEGKEKTTIKYFEATDTDAIIAELNYLTRNIR
jgi:hypothetical protein